MLSVPKELATELLNMLGFGVVIVTPDLERVLLMNRTARALRLGDPLRPPIRTAAALYATLRRDDSSGPQPIQIRFDDHRLSIRMISLRQDAAELLLVYPSDLAHRALSDGSVLDALRDGRSNEEIARLFGLSVSTVKKRLRGLYEQTGVSNRTQLAAVDRKKRDQS
jgi:hypothetical protein